MGVVLREPGAGSERLAAVFAARRPGAARGADPPTVPLPVVGGRGGPGRFVVALRRVVPAGWGGARVDPGRPGAAALALVAAVAATVAAVGVWVQRPQVEPVDALPAVTAPGAAAPPATGAAVPVAELVVSVVGRVRSPGLVRVPDGARVADVLAAAGGALPGVELAGLNLARRVADGEQVAVGVAPAPDAAPAGASGGPGGGSGSAGGGAGGGPLDLNQATAGQLDALPGIGPVTAERILEWRTRNGRFSRVEQLREVDGIGERRFAQLRSLVAVS